MPDLTTLASVKLYLGLTATAADRKLAAIITAASSWVESYLNRRILESPYTELLDGTGGPRIMTANYPITAITSVTIDSLDVTARAVTDGRRTIALVMREIGPVRSVGIPYNSTYFRRGVMNVSLSYTAGYATVPADLEHVVCRIAAWGYSESARLGEVSKAMGGEIVSFNQAAVPAWAKDSLCNWKKVIA